MRSDENPKFKRGIFLVDRAFQLRMTFQLLSVLGGAALLYALALYVLPGSEALKGLDADETRSFFFKTNLIYFGLATAILAVVSILLTHRIAGPARLVEQALEGMRRGDYSGRLSLRDGDFLRSLAATAEELREHLRRRDAAIADLASCLAEGDEEGARELLALLGAPPPRSDRAPTT